MAKTIDEKIDDLAIAVKHGFDEVYRNVGEVSRDVVEVKNGLAAVQMKVNSILHRQLDKHEHWHRQVAEKVGVALTS